MSLFCHFDRSEARFAAAKARRAEGEIFNIRNIIDYSSSRSTAGLLKMTIKKLFYDLRSLSNYYTI